jgi:hypothetical protein
MQHKLIRTALAAVGALLLAAPALADDDYEVGLVPCTESLCGPSGSAPFAQGSVSVEDEGRVEVELEGGPTSAPLCVEFRPLVGEPGVVGDLTTDPEGSADATVGTFEPGVFMGAFVVKDGACGSEIAPPLFITAFAVGPHQDQVDDGELGNEGEDDNDADGVLNDVDADDDNDQIDDIDDMDDDNDGIPDGEDADPDDANNFDNDDVEELKAAYLAERQELKDEYKADSSALKVELKDDKEALKEDLADRLDDF